MEVEYTGRQTTITKKLKDAGAVGLDRIGKLVGRSARAHVILTTDKYRKIAEVTVTATGQDMVALCEGLEMDSALREAVSKVEQQVVRYKQKRIKGKRHAKTGRQELHGMLEDAVAADVTAPTSAKAAAKNSKGRKAVPMVVHSFSTAAKFEEPHLVKTWEGVAEKPMTLEEAVKEAGVRDRDVFVFRDLGGQALVLHRRGDGKMELIEVP